MLSVCRIADALRTDYRESLFLACFWNCMELTSAYRFDFIVLVRACACVHLAEASSQPQLRRLAVLQANSQRDLPVTIFGTSLSTCSKHMHHN